MPADLTGKTIAFLVDKGDTFPVDATVDSADASSYDGLVLPGGVADPDFLRTQPAAVSFTKSFVDAGKPDDLKAFGTALVEAFAG